jgi:hypothetical protein
MRRIAGRLLEARKAVNAIPAGESSTRLQEIQLIRFFRTRPTATA